MASVNPLKNKPQNPKLFVWWKYRNRSDFPVILDNHRYFRFFTCSYASISETMV